MYFLKTISWRIGYRASPKVLVTFLSLLSCLRNLPRQFWLQENGRTFTSLLFLDDDQTLDDLAKIWNEDSKSENKDSTLLWLDPSKPLKYIIPNNAFRSIMSVIFTKVYLFGSQNFLLVRRWAIVLGIRRFVFSAVIFVILKSKKKPIISLYFRHFQHQNVVTSSFLFLLSYYRHVGVQRHLVGH